MLLKEFLLKMINSFLIKNFLNLEYQEYTIAKISNLNEEGIKSFFILKYLITLSEKMPNLVSMVDNEVRPNNNLPVEFKVQLSEDNKQYSYEIKIHNHQIVFEELIENDQIIFTRFFDSINLFNEPVRWNCPNKEHKVFLDACGTKENIDNKILFFFKEKVFALTKYLKNPLNDDILALFRKEENDVNVLFKDILIINEIYHYGDDINLLNHILDQYQLNIIPFKSINELRCRNFLKLNILLSWLVMIGGGSLFLEQEYLIYQDYINQYLEKHPLIQIIFEN